MYILSVSAQGTVWLGQVFNAAYCIVPLFVSVAGFESLSTHHLLQVACLSVEQAVRGRSLLDSLSSACSDVYIQSRHLSSEQKERLGYHIPLLLKIFR